MRRERGVRRHTVTHARQESRTHAKCRCRMRVLKTNPKGVGKGGKVCNRRAVRNLLNRHSVKTNQMLFAETVAAASA